MVHFNLWPMGREKCLTLSYDDGQVFDRELVRLMNENGVKGTFHLNTDWGDKHFFIPASEFAALFKGHEISAHGHTHPFCTDVPLTMAVADLMENRRILETAAGYPVRGMSYPYGRYNPQIITAFRTAGMAYARTVKSTLRFDVPDDFMQWHPTCHHKELGGLWETFIRKAPEKKLQLFYLWGHSYEFDRDGNFDMIAAFLKEAGGRENVWYATNIQIKDYVDAMRGLQFTCDEKTVLNPSGLSVWLTVNGEKREIRPWETVSLG